MKKLFLMLLCMPLMVAAQGPGSSDGGKGRQLNKGGTHANGAAPKAHSAGAVRTDAVSDGGASAGTRGGKAKAKAGGKVHGGKKAMKK